MAIGCVCGMFLNLVVPVFNPSLMFALYAFPLNRYLPATPVTISSEDKQRVYIKLESVVVVVVGLAVVVVVVILLKLIEFWAPAYPWSKLCRLSVEKISSTIRITFPW